MPMPSTHKLVEPLPQPVKPRSPPVGTLQVPEASVSRVASQRSLSAVSDVSAHDMGSPDLDDEVVELGTAIRVPVNSRRYSDLIAGRPSSQLQRASDNSDRGQTRASHDRRPDYDAISETSASETGRGRRGERRGFGEASELSDQVSHVSPSSERRFV